MNWLNTFLPQLRDDRFSGATPYQKGVWFSLITYCATMENGGWIINCGDWTDRQWMTTCGITKEDAESIAGLWEWNPPRTSLWIYAYPVEQEARMKAMRSGGKRGAKKRWKPKNVLPIPKKSAGDL